MVVNWKPRHAHRFINAACRCGAKDWAISRFITQAGHTRHVWFCQNCEHRSNLYEPNHPHLIYVKVFDESEQTACERCGRLGAEEHHWMPRHLRPSDCDQWPTGFLCQACHAEWHGVVTPGMGSSNG
jgi:hypothetical protein